MDQRESNRDERMYWHGVVRDFYRTQYGLDLDPAQADTALVPPLEAVVTIQDAGKADADIFFSSGYRTTLAYQTELHDYGYSPANMARILEMGVGLGRLIIHYFPFAAELYGCDVTPGVAAWTTARLGHRVRVDSTGHEPPLPYPDGHFDFVYAHSVFTHIPCNLAEPWAAELRRIIRPGGVLIFSVWDSNVYLQSVSQREFHERYLVPGCHDWNHDDGVLMLTYQSPRHIYRTWNKYFHVLEIRSQHLDQSHVICRRED